VLAPWQATTKLHAKHNAKQMMQTPEIPVAVRHRCYCYYY